MTAVHWIDPRPLTRLYATRRALQAVGGPAFACLSFAWLAVVFGASKSAEADADFLQRGLATALFALPAALGTCAGSALRVLLARPVTALLPALTTRLERASGAAAVIAVTGTTALIALPWTPFGALAALAGGALAHAVAAALSLRYGGRLGWWITVTCLALAFLSARRVVGALDTLPWLALVALTGAVWLQRAAFVGAQARLSPSDDASGGAALPATGGRPSAEVDDEAEDARERAAAAALTDPTADPLSTRLAPRALRPWLRVRRYEFAHQAGMSEARLAARLFALGTLPVLLGPVFLAWLDGAAPRTWSEGLTLVRATFLVTGDGHGSWLAGLYLGAFGVIALSIGRPFARGPWRPISRARLAAVAYHQFWTRAALVLVTTSAYGALIVTALTVIGDLPLPEATPRFAVFAGGWFGALPWSCMALLALTRTPLAGTPLTNFVWLILVGVALGLPSDRAFSALAERHGVGHFALGSALCFAAGLGALRLHLIRHYRAVELDPA